ASRDLEDLRGKDRSESGANGATGARGFRCRAARSEGNREEPADAEAAALLGCVPRREIRPCDGSGDGGAGGFAGEDRRGGDELSGRIPRSSQGKKAVGAAAGNGAGQARN